MSIVEQIIGDLDSAAKARYAYWLQVTAGQSPECLACATEAHRIKAITRMLRHDAGNYEAESIAQWVYVSKDIADQLEKCRVPVSYLLSPGNWDDSNRTDDAFAWRISKAHARRYLTYSLTEDAQEVGIEIKNSQLKALHDSNSKVLVDLAEGDK